MFVNDNFALQSQLINKKSFVRYVSHEIRTPLNTGTAEAFFIPASPHTLCYLPHNYCVEIILIVIEFSLTYSKTRVLCCS